jgi:hypothetical protein
MEQEPELISLRDEVFRKIGRNLLNFQKIELMLKHLLTNGPISGHLSELTQIREKRANKIRQKTMGSLVGEFVENTFLPSTKSATPTRLKEPYLSFSFSVEADADRYENIKQELKSLVDDRNDLTHHFLTRFNPESLESCLEANNYLDQQRERLLPQYDHLKSLIQALDEAMKAHVDYLNSEEGQKEFERQFLLQSSLVQLLLHVSVQNPRVDGWTYLSVAISQIRQILPGEMEQLERRWGYRNLADLMQASELFDIRKEAVADGGYRLVYRAIPELAYAARYRLMQSILETASQTAKSDGWTPLTTAAHHIDNALAAEFAEVREKLGYQSLHDFMIESEFFDFKEHNGKGQATVFYKPKAELALA